LSLPLAVLQQLEMTRLFSCSAQKKDWRWTDFLEGFQIHAEILNSDNDRIDREVD